MALRCEIPLACGTSAATCKSFPWPSRVHLHGSLGTGSLMGHSPQARAVISSQQPSCQTQEQSPGCFCRAPLPLCSARDSQEKHGIHAAPGRSHNLLQTLLTPCSSKVQRCLNTHTGPGAVFEPAQAQRTTPELRVPLPQPLH